MHTPHDAFWDVNTPMRTVNIVRNASAKSVCCCGRSDNKFDVDSPNDCTHFSRIQFAARTTHFGLSMRESELPKSIRKSVRLRSAPQSQNQTRDSLRKYNDARRGYRIAPVGYIYCGTFDTPKHWLDTEHINNTSNSPLSTITDTRTLTEKVFWIRLRNENFRKF